MSHTRDSLDVTSFAGFVGFDWADQKHAGALCAAGGKPEAFELDQTPEAIDLWATKMRERFEGRPVAVCLEQSKGALIYSLMKYDFIVLYPINPKQLSAFRKAMHPGGAKRDPSDADLILELLVKHFDRLHPWLPDDDQTRLIGIFSEDRRNLVNERTALTNALQARLKQYFPLALEVLGALDTNLACDLLLRWSSLEELQQADPEQIAEFYHEHHCHHPRLIAQRLEKIAQAKPLTTDRAIVTAGRAMVRTLAAQVQSLNQSIDHYEQELVKLVKQHPDAEIFKSFPGAGKALVPRLLAAFGTDRDRLDIAEVIQQMSGVAPVTIQSGKYTQVARRWACNSFLLQTFQEFAQHSRSQSGWANAYYKMLRARGTKHNAAIRALAFKWIRILFRCWKNRTLYNDGHYLKQLIDRDSPLLQYMDSQA